jgi:hypothetical protein
MRLPRRFHTTKTQSRRSLLIQREIRSRRQGHDSFLASPIFSMMSSDLLTPHGRARGRYFAPLPDFFVSRAGAHSADVAVASKVGQIIEAEGHRVVLQQWDFANRNFMERMDAALASGARVVAILTPQYLASDYCAAEWRHALEGDP